jgi:type IV pilus assembly protein PilC
MTMTAKGKEYLDTIQLSTPVIGNLYTKLYISRITDNLNTMLSSGVPIVRALDITSKVVGSLVYQRILEEVADGVKSGLSLSVAFEKHRGHIPPILIQMIAVGEETGSLGAILKTLTTFYEREVDGAVDTLVGLIEPAMILVLGVGVGVLCVSVLGPIYNMSSGIS